MSTYKYTGPTPENLVIPGDLLAAVHKILDRASQAIHASRSEAAAKNPTLAVVYTTRIIVYLDAAALLMGQTGYDPARFNLDQLADLQTHHAETLREFLATEQELFGGETTEETTP